MNENNWQRLIATPTFTRMDPMLYRQVRSKIMERIEGSPSAWVLSKEFETYDPTVKFVAEVLPAMISVRATDGKLTTVAPTFMETRTWLKEQRQYESEHKKKITEFYQATSMLISTFDHDLKRRVRAEKTWAAQMKIVDDHFLGPNEEAARAQWQSAWTALKVVNGNFAAFIAEYRELREQHDLLFESHAATDNLFVEQARAKMCDNFPNNHPTLGNLNIILGTRKSECDTKEKLKALTDEHFSFFSRKQPKPESDTGGDKPQKRQKTDTPQKTSEPCRMHNGAHTRKECPDNTARRWEANKAMGAALPSKKGSGGRHFNTPPPICTFCNKTGHTADDCWAKAGGPTCKVCNEHGHTSRNCTRRMKGPDKEIAGLKAEVAAVKKEVAMSKEHFEMAKGLIARCADLIQSKGLAAPKEPSKEHMAHGEMMANFSRTVEQMEAEQKKKRPHRSMMARPGPSRQQHQSSGSAADSESDDEPQLMEFKDILSQHDEMEDAGDHTGDSNSSNFDTAPESSDSNEGDDMDEGDHNNNSSGETNMPQKDAPMRIDNDTTIDLEVAESDMIFPTVQKTERDDANGPEAVGVSITEEEKREWAEFEEALVKAYTHLETCKNAIWKHLVKAYLDSGCSKTMSPDKTMFRNLRDLGEDSRWEVVTLADGKELRTHGVGELIIKFADAAEKRIANALYVPGLDETLLAAGDFLQSKDDSVVLRKDGAFFYNDKRREFMKLAESDGKLWWQSTTTAAMAVTVNPSNTEPHGQDAAVQCDKPSGSGRGEIHTRLGGPPVTNRGPISGRLGPAVDSRPLEQRLGPPVDSFDVSSTSDMQIHTLEPRKVRASVFKRLGKKPVEDQWEDTYESQAPRLHRMETQWRREHRVFAGRPHETLGCHTPNDHETQPREQTHLAPQKGSAYKGQSTHEGANVAQRG